MDLDRYIAALTSAQTSTCGYTHKYTLNIFTNTHTFRTRTNTQTPKQTPNQPNNQTNELTIHTTICTCTVRPSPVPVRNGLQCHLDGDQATFNDRLERWVDTSGRGFHAFRKGTENIGTTQTHAHAPETCIPCCVPKARLYGSQRLHSNTISSVEPGLWYTTQD